MSSRDLEAQKLEKEWESNPRWKGITRTYSGADVVRLRGSVQIEHTLAKRGAEKLWGLLREEPFVNALVCDGEDGRELAEYLRVLDGDAVRAEQMRQAGFATAHRYVWPNVLDTLAFKLGFVARMVR